MQNLNIGFIGGGNMAEALIAGLTAAGHAAERVRVTDISKARLDVLQGQYGINVCADIAEVAAASDVLLLAVKPQQIDDVLTKLGKVGAEKTVISIAAGISAKHIALVLGNDAAVVRVMPNTPCLVGEGMSVLFSNAGQIHCERAEYVLAASGQTAWIKDEQQMHAVTAVSGSGPAYFFLLAELMQAAGQALGLPRDLSEKLVGQTALGAARMLTESGKTAELLRQQVTSPGGTTQAALEAMFEGQLPDAVRNAISAAAKRSRELA
ncbi:MAG: pyrroline-5-carboxylate reductase [Zetaproteobacteria bacterium CG12_big_fil_rev_8_21_14_0_65_55_1124]|nr:MAG: pyrroline-5-carboxylate reductase [Zetaproteobacteria bacterium CG1_02_55_237]PIS19233.1 MAG: pyrroline-5-carboxylate reductase [Zetaproteobacteria bacterium CG08_land_8_20_14_0_20_55_17]PIW42907.1 MAG: pyrroline-5-carboxylate reductase [Zetaproteobacteria bacterium CG12_big_fil_rev_8_21_14_0_65_55_1124]PIY51870.1 MAG: pyrroline-5-carboxylate reductase [Zetaproteobacteria bacterium CG_4_10_14_0_8_um_filter_55_43]PIZ39930.1 MAG: pyrroline-5-carboxylate reductase [Zetaproteobacteria bacte